MISFFQMMFGGGDTDSLPDRDVGTAPHGSKTRNFTPVPVLAHRVVSMP